MFAEMNYYIRLSWASPGSNPFGLFNMWLIMLALIDRKPEVRRGLIYKMGGVGPNLLEVCQPGLGQFVMTFVMIGPDMGLSFQSQAAPEYASARPNLAPYTPTSVYVCTRFPVLVSPIPNVSARRFHIITNDSNPKGCSIKMFTCKFTWSSKYLTTSPCVMA